MRGFELIDEPLCMKIEKEILREREREREKERNSCARILYILIDVTIVALTVR